VPFRWRSIVKERYGDREREEQRERERERERDWERERNCLYVFSLRNNDIITGRKIAGIAANGVSSANLHYAYLHNRWCFSRWRKVIYRVQVFDDRDVVRRKGNANDAKQ